MNSNQAKSHLMQFVEEMPMEKLVAFIHRRGFRMTLSGEKRQWRAVLKEEGSVEYTGHMCDCPRNAMASAVSSLLLGEAMRDPLKEWAELE